MSKLTFFRDVLPWELITAVQNFALGESLCQVSSSTWEAGVVSKNAPVLCKPLRGDLLTAVYRALVARGIVPDVDITRVRITHYSWLPTSSIPWHTDNGYYAAATVYLNTFWDKDWGGYLAYLEEGSVRCIVPEFNAGVRLYPPIDHCVLSTQHTADARETLQVFVSPE